MLNALGEVVRKRSLVARLFGRVAATASAGRRLLAAAGVWIGGVSDKFGTGPIRLRVKRGSGTLDFSSGEYLLT